MVNFNLIKAIGKDRKGWKTGPMKKGNVGFLKSFDFKKETKKREGNNGYKLFFKEGKQKQLPHKNPVNV